MNNLDSMTMWELIKLTYSINAEIFSRVWVYMVVIGVLLVVIGVLLVVIGETVEYN